MIRAAIVTLLLIFVFTSCGSTAPEFPWGNAAVFRVVQHQNCIVYALVQDANTFWVLCGSSDR